MSHSKTHQNQVQVAGNVSVRIHAETLLHFFHEQAEDLKCKVLRWRSCLCDLIDTQRAFATFLGEWLSKFLLQEQGERETTKRNTLPFSSARMGVPDIFVSCHRWLEALGTTAVSTATNALEEYARSLHNLCKTQNEERALRLWKEFVESWITSNSSLPGSQSDAGIAQALANTRRKLEELEMEHARVLDRVRFLTSDCMKDGLIKVFIALENMCTEFSNAYSQISQLS